MDPPVTRLIRGLGLGALVIAGPAFVYTVAGGWWAPFGLGLLVGVLAARARVALPIGAGLGLLAWGVPLVIEQFQYSLGPAAASLSAILGLGHQGLFAIILTLMVGLLLGLTGAWLGSAARALVPLSRRARGTAAPSRPKA
jgi:hypothetical protein